MGKLSDWTPEAPALIDDWNEYFEEKLRETRDNWGGILEVAAVLHPGVNHNRFLTQSEILRALETIRHSMEHYGYQEPNSQADEEACGSQEHLKSAELAVMRLTSRGSVPVQDELGLYLNRKRPNITAEDFWGRQPDLQCLTKVAHDYLGIIPSSAATERTFSCAGRIETIRRLRMSDTSLEASVLVAMNSQSLLQPNDVGMIIEKAYHKMRERRTEKKSN